MAKITLSKLTPVKKIDPIVVIVEGQEITVIQYLPINEKLKLIETVLNEAIDDSGFFNPVRLDIYTNIELIKFYTNISITDKMMEDPAKLYDLLEMNGIIAAIIDAIPTDEYDIVYEGVSESIAHAIDYLNSFVGMMKTISQDYKNSEINVDKIVSTLGDPNQIGLVKDILDKIG